MKKKTPILWDLKHSLHFPRNQKLEAWSLIANDLKIDVFVAKQKIHSLLGSFHKEKAKGNVYLVIIEYLNFNILKIIKEKMSVL